MTTLPIVVMGVASSGKSTIGRALAQRLKATFVEGDELHPTSNVAKMSAGVPLTDEDRWPWLTRVGDALRGSSVVVASCSALKRSYRKYISGVAHRPVLFVFLHGEKGLLEERIRKRENHFMPASLLASQLDILEPPTSDERALAMDATLPVDEIVEQVVTWLETVNQS